MRLIKILAALAVCLALVAPAWGQGQQVGTIGGTVRSEDGEGLPGVLVTVTSDALQGERTAVTGATGNFVVRGLPAGEYTVMFQLEGMKDVERTETVAVGSLSDVDAEMEVAEVEETIVVTGESPTALENTTIGANYDKETVDNLAVGRTLRGIALLSPNVNDTT
ncbi:MAG: carboxypeptidase-like regulatory domain-containing protein, partial [Thermoanaerobaculia bacterium]|nr:carboxypeptidase-like regulatory domain-containing protein [Thermoanaerobaculia bacterium]